MSRRPSVDLDALRADPRVVWIEDVIRFGDTDKFGHVNNAVFAVFCESGRVNYLAGILGPEDARDRYFVLAKFTLEFRAELHYPGRVRSGTWIAGLGRTSVTFGQVLVDEAGTLAAVSQSVTVGMDRATRRPAPLREPSRACLEARRLPPEASGPYEAP